MQSNNAVVAGVAALSVSLGVTVGLLASSSSAVTDLYAPVAVRPGVSTQAISQAPLSRASRVHYSASEQSGSDNLVGTPAQDAVEHQSGNVFAGAFLAAGAAAAALFVSMRKRATSAYETIRSDPEAVLANAGRAMGVAATSAVLAGSASAASLTFDEFQSLSYNEMKGTGLSNTCPILAEGGGSKLDLKPGNYKMEKMCLEPSSFMVKVPPPDDKTVTDFETTKLMTRLTYTLDGIEADLTVGGDGSWSIKEKDGIDYAATTVQLQGGERVPFLFTVRDLDAKGDASQFLGQFNVASYRGGTFLDPKGRGGATGYDVAVALPAAGDQEELSKENLKSMAGGTGTIAFKVAKVNAETGEVAGVFESIQPSDTDLGAKVPKDVKASGVWYAQISKA